MLPKGEGCRGCPFWQDGQGFVPDTLKPGATLRVVAQNPGADEVRGNRFLGWSGGGERWETGVPPQPLIGKSGYELRHTYLPLAGVEEGDVEYCNVIRCRWKNSNDLPPLNQTLVRDAIRHCQRAHWREPSHGTVIAALGAYSLWALTGEYQMEGADEDDDSRANRGIEGWRGWSLPSRPIHLDMAEMDGRGSHIIFATYHPAYYYRAHWLKPVGRADWRRFGRLLRGEWPEAFPDIYTSPPGLKQNQLAYDTEFVPATNTLIRYSLACRLEDGTPIVWAIEAGIPTPVIPIPHIIGHNLEADWPYLIQVFGTDTVAWDDTMYMHSALHGTLRHTLDFCGSIYARTNRWKHLEQTDPITYAGLDALGTWDVFQALQREMQRDHQTQRVYEEELKPLLPHLIRRPSIRLDVDRVQKALEDMTRQQEEIVKRAQTSVGWPIQPSSPDHVARWIGVK